VLAMSYILFFDRAVAYASAPSETTFAATLAAFLLGLAAGAHHAGGHCALFSAEEVMRRAARSAMAANLLGLATLPLLGAFAWLDRAVIVVAMLLCFVVARALGALLPYLAEFAVTADARAKLRSALLCLAYATGATAGAWVTGRVLMDELGLVAVGVTLVIAGILYTLLLVALLDLPRWQKIVRGMTAAAVAILALVLLPRWSADVVERLQWKAAADGTPHVSPNRERRS
jgi:spermidine synthase